MSWALKKRSVALASAIIVSAMMVANTYALAAFGLGTIPYLFAPTVVFSSVLFDQVLVPVVVIAASGIVIRIGSAEHGQSLSSPYVICPVSVICLTALASWLSSRNPYAALKWAWSGYTGARRNEEQLREQRMRLRRTLKALDEPNYRIRSMSYQLGLVMEWAEEARRHAPSSGRRQRNTS